MAGKASTYRIDPEVQAALVTLSKVLRRPMNQLVNEAVRAYVQQRIEETSEELESSLPALRKYRKRDPDFENAIDAFVKAELAGPDPLEGKIVDSRGPVESKVLSVLNA